MPPGNEAPASIKTPRTPCARFYAFSCFYVSDDHARVILGCHACFITRTS